MEKSMQNIQEKCQSCGGNLKFSPEQKALACEFCKNTVSILHDTNTQKHFYEENKEDLKTYNEFKNKTKIVKCSNCGASIILDKLQVSKNCPYCDSPSVIETKEIAGLVPDSIIPFKFSEKTVVDIFKQGLKKKRFLPNKFKKNPPVENIKGIYIPCFSFDANSTTKYSGILVEKTSNSNGKTKTKIIPIAGNYNCNFENFGVESSSHINQIEYNQIKPYQMQDLVKFDTSFIMGYSVEYYNQSLTQCKTLADTLMKENIKNAILRNYSYSYVQSFSQETLFSQQKYSYNLMPLYKISCKYKQKSYTALMNGQTGKLGGNFPKSKIKITLFVLMWIIIVCGIIALFIID